LFWLDNHAAETLKGGNDAVYREMIAIEQRLAKAVREVETAAESEYRRRHAAAGATLPGGNREGVLPWGGEGSNRVLEGGGKTWYKADGSLNLPPNYGAVSGTEKVIDLQPGAKLGRYGGYGELSNFVAAPGSASDALSLPPYTNTSIYQEFTVLKPIPGVTQSTVAPWGGSVGGGMQFKLPMTIPELIYGGYIK
jgi:hypothetical protein